ncbi:MAG: hypothetical protein WDN45_05625 [Caulobacteraceae bacterium]
MTKRSILIGVAISALSLAASAGAATAASKWTPPRTPWGDPDLQGTWPLDQLGRTPLQRDPKYGDRGLLTDEEYAAALASAKEGLKGAEKEEKEGKLGGGHWFEYGVPLRQTSLIVEPANGRLPPFTEKGKQLAATEKSSWTEKVFESPADFNSLDRCITRGLPASMIPFPYNNGVRIFQSPGYVVIQLELVHETRIIPLDSPKHLPNRMETWIGDSRGHFEGNTLVIDTTNFNGGTPMTIVSSRATTTAPARPCTWSSRLTPVDHDHIQYEMTVSDPDVLTAPWKMSFPWTRNDKYEFFEYACNEGNTVVPNYIRSTSPRFAEERGRNGASPRG